ncbi:MAG TPA: hypothetical protein VKP67_01700 [Xanthobacteraceae bacterium]|nr:hypothetical protein [Xanthobacteraceae bacterium]
MCRSRVIPQYAYKGDFERLYFAETKKKSFRPGSGLVALVGGVHDVVADVIEQPAHFVARH